MRSEMAREQMIKQQLRAWHVLDGRVLQTMSEVPREAFLPEAYRGLAFADAPVPIGHDQVMLAPKIQGRLLQALALTPDDIVLDVGTGTGFLAACMAQLSTRVSSIDIYPDLVGQAAARLAEFSVRNVSATVADATTYAPAGQFDAIAITAALPVYQDRFQELLAPGGRLFVVVGMPPIREAWLVTRDRDGFRRQVLFETEVPAMINAPLPEAFVF
jgi:protein-L-isoaspartate(D-aspartate) O-methyltransferase